jgi:hypothetical protein
LSQCKGGASGIDAESPLRQGRANSAKASGSSAEPAISRDLAPSSLSFSSPRLADRWRYFEDPALSENTRLAAPKLSAHFEHAWPQWLRQAPEPPTDEAIAEFLDAW